MKELENRLKETVAFQKSYIDYRDVVDPTDVPWLETYRAGWEAHARYMAETKRFRKIKNTIKRKSGRKNEVRTPRKKATKKRRPLTQEHKDKISQGRRARFANLRSEPQEAEVLTRALQEV